MTGRAGLISGANSALDEPDFRRTWLLESLAIKKPGFRPTWLWSKEPSRREGRTGDARAERRRAWDAVAGFWGRTSVSGEPDGGSYRPFGVHAGWNFVGLGKRDREACTLGPMIPNGVRSGGAPDAEPVAATERGSTAGSFADPKEELSGAGLVG